ncbi:head-tail connector protein [Alkalihalobacillus sp. LMS6]|uniref:head-tail connector protein n=1 Tax=Alkalihalobacillus sp. LMS6 TaxID=2924034 RepID=UPI0020D0C3BF|nr:head-tail connector protein [Alkalihalobacillus sp. LMS6]UTR05454.1 head-tail connector protein [Alkalihalobacillus sp. LMS6]
MLSEVKQYLRVFDESEEEDLEIQMMIEAAKESIRLSTGKRFNEENSLHRLCLCLYVSHNYENRGIYTVDKHKDLSYSLTTMLTLIKYGSDDDAQVTPDD